MGVSDVRSIIGNRCYDQQGKNFDKCLRKLGSDDHKKAIKLTAKQIDEYIPEYHSLDDIDPNDSCHSALSLITLENAVLVLEAIRVDKKKSERFEKFCPKPNIESEKDMKLFQKYIWNNRTDVKKFLAHAYCDEWEFSPVDPNKDQERNYDKLPEILDYFDCNDSGIFKLPHNRKHGAVEDIPVCQPEDLFIDYEYETEEIWIRVWYEQFYSGVIEAEKYDSMKISDQLLVWAANELGMEKINKYTRRKLFRLVKEKVMEIYYS